MGRTGAFVAVLALAAGTAPAQEAIPPSLGEVVVPSLRSPLLTIDEERLFARSAFGRRVLSEIDDELHALAAENRRIEAELTAEERRLTELRPTLAPEEFTARADDFDTRVEAIRAEQDAKSREITSRRDAARQTFLQSALPVLSALMREAGAVAILDPAAIVVSFEAIDVTDAAVARIDAALGDGRDASPAPDPAPEAPPVTVPGAAPEAIPEAAPAEAP